MEVEELEESPASKSVSKKMSKRRYTVAREEFRKAMESAISDVVEHGINFSSSSDDDMADLTAQVVDKLMPLPSKKTSVLTQKMQQHAETIFFHWENSSSDEMVTDENKMTSHPALMDLQKAIDGVVKESVEDDHQRMSVTEQIMSEIITAGVTARNLAKVPEKLSEEESDDSSRRAYRNPNPG